ncbi:MAG: 2-hydroxy-3-oxopropionate reductase [Gallionella sp.]
MNIGFIGPGIMGGPMARNLMKGGHKLWVYARRPEAMKSLEAAGATACSSPAEVARHADVIFTMVSDTPDVESVIFGEAGLAPGIVKEKGARSGSVVVDMSTISPTATKVFAERLAKQGIDMLDAPVSGGETGAINGTLSIMVGGKASVFERVKPLFELMGKNIVRIGENGAGQVAKACNQIVVAVTIEAVAEALTFAQRNGADATKVREALMGGFAGSKIMEVHGKRMLDNDFKPGFKVGLHQKDMRIVMETAHQLGVALPAAALVTQHLNALMGTGDTELDSAAVVKVVKRMSGMGDA